MTNPGLSQGHPWPIAALIISIASGLTPGRPLAAQGTDVRTALVCFRDSLASTSDAAAVDRLRRAITKQRKKQGGALVNIQEGLVELRRAALGRPERAGNAEQAFERAREEAPGWPWPWYGIGLAEKAQATRKLENPLNIGYRVGVGDMEDAMAAFSQAVVVDSAFEPALLELARVALRLRTPERLEEALAVMRNAGVDGWSDWELYHLLGVLEFRVGDPKAALAAFARLPIAGAPNGLALLEEARVLLAADSGGENHYYRGARSANPAVVAGYRRDIQYIAYQEELVAFDTAHGAARSEMLRAFWSKRDAADLRPQGERLREHYARLAYARRHYWLDVTRRHYWLEDRYASEQIEFDDRGIIFLRHGHPTMRLTPFVYGSTANESWRYDRADGLWLAHFCAKGDLRDYRLIESAMDIADSRCNTGGVMFDQILATRFELSPIYTRLASWGRYGRAKMAREERAIGQTTIAAGTTTDSHELRFAAPLDAAIMPLVVGRADSMSLVHLVVGVDQLPGDTIPLRIRFFVYDDSARAIASVDSMLVPVSLSGTNGHAAARLELPVPPGDWTYRVAVQQGDSTGKLFPRDSIAVHDFSTPGPRLSDLMIGSVSRSLRWLPASRDTAYIDPHARFLREDTVELYYEVYGLEAGVEVTTRIALRPAKKKGMIARVFGGSPPEISLQFQERATGLPVLAHRRIGLGSLEPGSYLLAIEVTGGDRSSVRYATLIVEDGYESASD